MLSKSLWIKFKTLRVYMQRWRFKALRRILWPNAPVEYAQFVFCGDFHEKCPENLQFWHFPIFPKRTKKTCPKFRLIIGQDSQFFSDFHSIKTKIFLSASFSCLRFYIFVFLFMLFLFRDLVKLEQCYSSGTILFFWNNFILLELLYSFGISLFFWNDFILLY